MFSGLPNQVLIRTVRVLFFSVGGGYVPVYFVVADFRPPDAMSRTPILALPDVRWFSVMISVPDWGWSMRALTSEPPSLARLSIEPSFPRLPRAVSESFAAWLASEWSSIAKEAS